MLELLAPAGSMEALRAAVQNGADAVYLGCGAFNARQSAKNFTPQTLVEAIKYCHVRGVQVHLTLNTLVSDREMTEAAELIRHAAQNNIDAFIVQDLGVVQLCRQIAPGVPIHGSTQMTVHSLPGVLLCAAMGMKRVVLSRELSREEIRYICANSPIEIEVFVHGALCMCYSGQCYMSAMIGGRSGNRGRCAQPCRQSYGYGRWEEKYPLSLKDNCLVRSVQELAGMGVASIKLEGRTKRPEYVAAVTGVYRRALDGEPVTSRMEQTLYTAFNRQGFTSGYYTGRRGSGMFGVRENTAEDAAFLRAMRRTYETGEAQRVPVHFQMTVRPGLSRLTAADPDGHVCEVAGPAPEVARVVPLTELSLSERLAKTGGTPYRAARIELELAPELSLSAADINAMRRDALSQLTALRARRETPHCGAMRRYAAVPNSRETPGLTVQVAAREQITPTLLAMHPERLYVPLSLLAADESFTRALGEKVRLCAVLPRIAHDGELPALRKRLALVRSLGVREALAGELGLVQTARSCGMRVRGDFGLNLFNSGALNTARELELLSATLSFELTLPQIRDLQKPLRCELLAYGRLPLMVTENCLIHGRTGACTCGVGQTKLVDKTGAEFPILRDGDTCRSVLYNGRKLYWLDRQADLARLGLWAVRLAFTTENAAETDRVLAAYHTGAPFDPGAYTRGLYLRGVE